MERGNLRSLYLVMPQLARLMYAGVKQKGVSIYCGCLEQREKSYNAFLSYPPSAEDVNLLQSRIGFWDDLKDHPCALSFSTI